MADMSLSGVAQLRTDGGWAGSDEVIWAKLWFEFLVLSPSYELARKDRTGTLTAGDQGRIPSDFDDVLAVYEDLGDVQRVCFDEWWIDKGFRFFGYRGQKPRLGPIGVLVREYADPLNTLMVSTDAYLKGRWREQGQPPSAVVSIPLSLSREQIVQQITHLLTFYDDDLKHGATSAPKYSPSGRKRDTNSLFRYIKCVTVKAYFPSLKLFEIGAHAGLSSTYSSRFETRADNDDRHALKILTSRALYRGMMLAENAARGIFPSYHKHQHAVKADWDELSSLLEARQDWQDARV